MAAKKNKSKSAEQTKKEKRKGADLKEQLDNLKRMTTDLLKQGKAEHAIDSLLDIIGQQGENIERLSFIVNKLNRAHYGRRSEKLTAEELGQLVLALGGSQEEANNPTPNIPTPEYPSEDVPQEPQKDKDDTSKPPKRRRPNHKGRTQLDPNLPRETTTVLVPDSERNCIHCGVEMEPFCYVIHETVEFIPAQILVKEERREKVACKNEDCQQDINTAPRQNSEPYAPRAGHSLLANLIESKCDDALPIYRQRDQLKRLGFNVPLNTLYGYWTYGTQLIIPVAECILSTVLGDFIVGIDDTKLDYLDHKNKSVKKRGHLWCFKGDSPLVAFAFTKTWAAQEVEPWISAVDGFIQCDDYKGYGSTVKTLDGKKRILVPPQRRLGCMMHVRRHFFDAFIGGYYSAGVGLKFIKEIYEIEKIAKKEGLSPPERYDLRQKESIPILDNFDNWVDVIIANERPTSPLAKAARYAKDQRPFVRLCFTDGRFEIDNGRVERDIKKPVIGRKNYLFAGSVQGAERLAAAYTVVMSARHVGVPVRTYLIDIICKIEAGWPLKRLEELMPHRWAESFGINLTNQPVQ